MAEYAGLEIRIGGNTTKLNSALKSSTKSAAELYTRIRQITKAMKFDPTDLGNVETRIKITGDRMQSLQAKTKLVKTAMEQLGDSIVTLGGKERRVKDVATSTDNLSLAAKQADERYVKLTGSLAGIYDAWNKMARSKGVDFAYDMLNIDKRTGRELMDAATSTDKLRRTVGEFNEARRSGLEEGPIISDKQVEKLIQLKQLDFHNMFKRGLDLDDVVQQARDLGVAIEDDAVESVRDLQGVFKEAAEDKKAFDKALKHEQMGTDVQRLVSEAESLSQTMRQLDDTMTETTKGADFQNLESEIRRVDAAMDSVEKDLERTEAAMKVDPSNIQLAARHFGDLQQKAALAEEKESLLNKEMELLSANGARDAAADHADLARWIEESAEKARVAKKELSDQKAEVANLGDAVKDAVSDLALMKRDKTLIEYSDNVRKWKEGTEQLVPEMKRLEDATRKAAESQADFDKMSAPYEEAVSKSKELRKELNNLQRRYSRLEKASEKAFDEGAFTDDMLAKLTEVESKVQEVTEAYSQAKAEASKLGEDLHEPRLFNNKAQSDLDTQRRKVERLKESVESLSKTKEVKLFKNPTEEIAREEAALEKLEGELEEAKREEKQRQAAYDSAAAENNLAKESKALEDVSQKAEEARTDLIKAQKKMKFDLGSFINPSTLKSVGMTLSATATPVIYGIGRSMIDASGDIDTAYRNMRKTVDGTEEQFSSLLEHAREFSATHVTSADQILEIEALGGELGIATENLTAFAEAISNIEVSTDLDTEEAAETLGHLANILHLTSDDYDGFSDALVRLGNNGASTESEIANIAERIGSMGSIVGMSASDVLAWASSIASTGQNAEAAGTAISKTMSFFETAVAAAGGSLDTSFESINAAVQEGGDQLTVFANLAGQTADDFAESWEADPKATFEELSESVDGAKSSLQGIADIAHMTAGDFAKAWESDPTEAMKAFIEGLNDIEASGGSADAVLQNLGITSVRQKQAIEGLMQTIGGLDSNLQMSEDAWNGVTDKWGVAGDAANEAAKKAEGFSGQLQIMKNVAKNALSELGEGAAPILQLFTGMLSSASGIFSGLTTEVKTFIVAGGGLTALTGPALTLASSFLTASENVKKWWTKATSGISIVQAAYAEGSAAVGGSLEGMNSHMSALALTAKQLGKSLLKNLAFAAAAIGITILISSLKKLYDQYQDHIAATSGMTSALLEMGKEAEVTAGTLDGVSLTYANLREDSKQYESRLADLAETIKSSNSEYGKYAGTLSYYADTVRDLADKEDRTTEESAKLASALIGINDACGTSYSINEYGDIIDDQTGKIVDDTEAIYDNIEARRAQARMEYYADDYEKAVGELTEAQDKLNAATEEYNDLTSAEGRKAYFDRAKEIYGNAYSESDTQAAYDYDVSEAKKTMERYSSEVKSTERAVSALEKQMDSAQKELDDANESMEKATAAQEEYEKRVDTVTADVTGNMKKLSDAMDEAGGDDSSFNSIAEGLEAIHVSAEELDGVDMTSLIAGFDSANGSMDEVIRTLEDGGVYMTTWNSALEQAPGAAENMGSLTAAAFQSMYEIAGSSLEDTMTLIAGLNAVQVDDKTFYITDNGSIMDEQGQLYNIKSDLGSIPPEVVTAYYVDDADAQKKALDAKAKLDSVGKQSATATIKVDDKASKPTQTLKDKLGTLNSYSAKPTASLTDHASSGLSSISRQISNLDGRHATVTVTTVKKTVPGSQATGGYNTNPVIPRHATGYIATGPTLTNQGWIGEDGIEAVANWATGGVVVPLTNKKYMLPIADAIADGMAYRMGGGGTSYNLYINDAIVNGDAEVQSAMLSLFDVLARKGAMNVG